MTDIQLFAFVALPVIVVVGAVVLLLVERRNWKPAQSEPDLFDPPRTRSIANSEGLGRPSKSGRS